MAMETTDRAWNSSEINTDATSTQPAQNAMRSVWLLVEMQQHDATLCRRGRRR